MNDFLEVIASLLAALWWGGLVTIDLILYPAILRTPRLEQSTIAAASAYMFKQFGRVQIAFGLLLLLVLLLAGAELGILLVALFMLLLTLLDVLLLEPAMHRLREQAGGTLEEGTTEYQQHQQVRRAEYATDVFKIILGAMLVAAIALA